MSRGLNKKIKNSVFFALIEQGISVIFGFLSTYLIIKYIDRKIYGIYNYVLSFMVLINFINIVPANYMFKLKNNLKDEEELNVYITSFFVFEIIKGIFIFILNVILGIVLYLKFLNGIYLFIAIMSNGVLFFINQMIAVSRMVLNINFLQKKITKYRIKSTILKLLLLLLLLVFPKLEIVILANLFSQLFFGIMLYKILVTDIKFHFSKLDNKIIYKKNKQSIRNYTLTTHLLGVVSNIIYRIDPLILSGFVTMTTLGRYSVALNLGNYFMIIFQVLQNNASIALANISDEVEENTVISKFLTLSVVLSIIQYALFILFGKIFLSFFIEVKEITEIYNYMKYILLGLSIYNSMIVLGSYIALRNDPKILLLNVAIPTGIFSIIIYFGGAVIGGAVGVAVGNIIAYIFFSTLLIREVRKTNFKFILFNKYRR
ncbi:hypothetical protein EV215_1874 [Hypnocyclicus thermotrophus]|uniref:O-antigen/teichoic acid export membrane protein n=1 Tax=Hypnocyclicus thermotrophus TaxID=1627895 RepID=A0AA46DX57_9FUSO|nr:hypothetical protein [Hypnocyclicus thermotrophus]TDT67871.1 hypothetical protein EV215_1874 [Hypnocyclicus thermotrophus]